MECHINITEPKVWSVCKLKCDQQQKTMLKYIYANWNSLMKLCLNIVQLDKVVPLVVDADMENGMSMLSTAGVIFKHGVKLCL